MGNKGLRDRGWVFSAPKMLIIINQHENSAATKLSREEGDERPTGSVLGGLMANAVGGRVGRQKGRNQRRLPVDVF